MKIWMHSCHAGYEYDLTKALTAIGLEVTGLFDVGSTQRPKIEGITDVDQPGNVHQAAKDHTLDLDMIGNPDAIVLHQTMNYPLDLVHYAAMRKPVILTVFGQGNMGLHTEVVNIANQLPNVHVVVYSLKALRIYGHLGMPPDQLHFIRFAKDEIEFNPYSWKGTDPVCFIPHNDVQNRGTGCGWPIVEQLIKLGLPIKLAGLHTEQVGGLGELPYERLLEEYQNCAVMYSPGTYPAPYTLTFVEAASSGMPVIVNDSGSGLNEEGIPCCMTHGFEGAARAIRDALNNAAFRDELNILSIQMREDIFDPMLNQDKWAGLFESLGTKGE